MSATPETVVRDYYRALREGDALAPYFFDDASTVKFGISEALYGFEDVATAIAEQTDTTDDWTVESKTLRVENCGEYATMADEVTMAWTPIDTGERRRFETRWSGTLVDRSSATGTDGDEGSIAETDAVAADRPPWQFRTMHVSVAHEV